MKCLSCDIISGLHNCDLIIENEHFNAHQDVAYPVLGLVIVASKRHFKALDDMSDEESLSLIQLMKTIRSAQRKVLGIDVVYYFYNEDTGHHFNMWMVPRHPWMSQFGKSVESVRPSLFFARDNMAETSNLRKVAEANDLLREHLKNNSKA